MTGPQRCESCKQPVPAGTPRTVWRGYDTATAREAGLPVEHTRRTARLVVEELLCRLCAALTVDFLLVEFDRPAGVVMHPPFGDVETVEQPRFARVVVDWAHERAA